MTSRKSSKSEPQSLLLRHSTVGLVHRSNFRPSPNINSSKFTEYMLYNFAPLNSEPHGNQPCREHFYVVQTCSEVNK